MNRECKIEMDLLEKIVVVTGTSGSIGKNIVRSLTKKGDFVEVARIF